MSSDLDYDVIIIGSGASGSAAAVALCQAGARVLMLEAGPPAGHLFRQSGVRALGSKLYRHFFSHRQPIQEQHPGYWETHPDLFIDDVDNPYSTPTDRPFRWIRGQQVGGRTMTWGGVCLRLSDYEFKAARLDGFGVDWPLEYKDLIPHYDTIEDLLGIYGATDGLPQLPDGKYVGSKSLTSLELRAKELIKSRWGDRHLIVARGLEHTKSIVDGDRIPTRSVQANLLRVALNTGKLKIQPNSVVNRLICNPDSGQVQTIEYLDRLTEKVHELPARVTLLCASTIESLRILLASDSHRHPGGIGSSSGVLGTHIMDHPAIIRFFYFPNIPSERTSSIISGCDGLFIPRFQNLSGHRENYLRGFGMSGGFDRLFLPKIIRGAEVGSSAIGFLLAQGEGLPFATNKITLDPSKKDSLGRAVPNISVGWEENDHRMVHQMRITADEIIAHLGGVQIEISRLIRNPILGGFIQGLEEASREITVPGLYVHEAGGARMGTDPASSVVNHWGQCWESKNLFIVDGACWPSGGWQNPTLTEMALAHRAGEHVAQEMKRRSL